MKTHRTILEKILFQAFFSPTRAYTPSRIQVIGWMSVPLILLAVAHGYAVAVTASQTL